MKPWKLLKTEIAFEGWRPVVYKTFRHPRGHEVKVDVMDDPGDASMIALTPEGKVIVGEQYRCGPEKVLNEIIGGRIDEGEDPETAAIRELAEEAGYVPGSVEYLGYVYREAWRNGKSHYFLATDCTPRAEGQELDEFEVINVKEITISQLIDNAKDARMTDAGGVMLAYDRLKELEGKYETTN